LGVPVENLDEWNIDMFKRMEATGRNLGGVYMHRNSLSMSAAAEYCVEPNFIYAPLTLMINHQVQLPEEHAPKEDYMCAVSSTPYSMAGCCVRSDMPWTTPKAVRVVSDIAQRRWTWRLPTGCFKTLATVNI
jgi:hypothetical protein